MNKPFTKLFLIGGAVVAVGIVWFLRSTSAFVLPSIPVNVAYTHSFTADLIPLLGPESNPRIYTFSLGSGVGFPPTGLVLGVDGVLKGAPKIAGTSRFQVCIKNAGGTSACRTYSLTVTPKTTPTPSAKPSHSPTPSKSSIPGKTPTPTPTSVSLDLNGLWKNDVNAGTEKITQTGNSIVITWYQVDPNSRWQEQVGGVAVQATLNGNTLTGQIKVLPEKGYCPGTSWWHAYTANVSADGTTIQEHFQSIMYYHETCQETGGSYPQKTDTLTKIQ